jgi:hypothetical protein
MERTLYLLLSFVTAMLAALLVAMFAHYNLGLSREAIRIAALSVTGCLVTAFVVVGFFKRK